MSFVTSALSSLVGGAGAVQQGNGNAQAADYNAAIARQNATIATQQGIAASEAQSRDAQRKIGAMIASYGASGVSSGSGSPMDVLADSAAMSTLDNLTVKYNYALKAASATNQATLNDMQAKNARTSGILNASAFGLKGISQLAGMSGLSIPGFGSDAWATSGSMDLFGSASSGLGAGGSEEFLALVGLL